MNAFYNGIASRIEMLYNSSGLKELCYSPAGKELMQIYNNLTGNNYCNICPNTMYPILLDFRKNYTYLIEKKMSNILKKRLFKAGASYSFFGDGTVYTNQNLTDEIADMIIEAHENNSNLFEVIEFRTEEVEVIETEEEKTVTKAKAKK